VLVKCLKRTEQRPWPCQLPLTHIQDSPFPVLRSTYNDKTQDHHVDTSNIATTKAWVDIFHSWSSPWTGVGHQIQDHRPSRTSNIQGQKSKELCKRIGEHVYPLVHCKVTVSEAYEMVPGVQVTSHLHHITKGIVKFLSATASPDLQWKPGVLFSYRDTTLCSM
jgi:hypothetical protein